MTITTIVENLAYPAGLIAEHGLSVLIETDSRKILFDTGQGNALVHNAHHLNIDLTEIDDVVISHGHYDHTGGLEDLLNINNKVNIYIKEEAFAQKLKGTTRQIGISNSTGNTINKIHLIKKPCEIAQGIFVMHHIPILNPADTAFSGFMTETDNGLKSDEFDDELYLAIVIDGKLVILSGCSHRGISNILQGSVNHFNMPVKLVLGGFHLMNCTEEQYITVVNTLRSVDPELIGVCHCTGVDKYCDMRRDIGTKVFYNYCGNSIHLKE